MSQALSADTRERILDAAERLFMAHGFEGTSMRQITGDASVNLAAVNYHFGSKEALMREVFRRRLQVLNQERLRVLERLEAQAAGQAIKPSLILDGFFGTLLRIAHDESRGGLTFLRLLGRTLTDPSAFIRAFLADENQAVAERYKQALFKALPDVPRAEIVWRFQFMLGATSYAIAGADDLSSLTDWGLDPARSEPMEWLEPRLMSFLMGGLRAPLPVLPGAGDGAQGAGAGAGCP